MTRRIALLIGAAMITLCTGCQGTITGSNPAPAGAGQTAPAAAAGTSNSDQLNSQLDNLQSSLNNIQSQLSADAAP